MKLIWIAWFLIWGIPGLSIAQKTYTYNNQVWVGYYNTIRFSDHWGAGFDGSVRTKDHMLDDVSQILFRLGGTWYVRDNVRATMGYVFSEYFNNDNHPLTNRIEHRPYEMIQWFSRPGKFRLQQTARWEQRFRQRIENGDLVKGFQYMSRLRLASQVARLLGDGKERPGSVWVGLGGELFYHLGREVQNNHFDQFRAWLIAGYVLNNALTFQLAYMYQLQQFPKGNGFNKLNAIRVNLVHQFDLRKNKQQTWKRK